MHSKLTLALAAAALTACASSGVYVDQNNLTEFKKGQTTSQQAIQKLGTPSQRTVDGNGNTTLIYSYFETTARPETFIPIIGGLVGGADTRSNVVTLTFSPDDKLKDYQITGSQTGTGMGLSAGVLNQRIDTKTRTHNQSPVAVPNE